MTQVDKKNNFMKDFIGKLFDELKGVQVLPPVQASTSDMKIVASPPTDSGYLNNSNSRTIRTQVMRHFPSFPSFKYFTRYLDICETWIYRE